MRVMIVGNDPRLLGLLSVTARFLGLGVNLAHSSEQALQTLLLQHHNVILLSLDLPDYDCYSTAQAIRQLERTCAYGDVSIICGLSGYRGGSDSETCRMHGMDICYTVPQTTSEAIRLLTDCLASVKRR